MAKAIRRSYEARHKRLGIDDLRRLGPRADARVACRPARRGMPDQAFVFASGDVLSSRAHADPLGVIGDGLELLSSATSVPRRSGAGWKTGSRAGPPACESGMQQPPEARRPRHQATFCAELHTPVSARRPRVEPENARRFRLRPPATRPTLTRLIELQASVAPTPPLPDAAHGPALKDPNDIDEDAVRTMVAAVQELKAVTGHTFVLRDIMNPALLEPLPAEELAHWRAVAERIARESDATLLDLNDGTFVASDFGDRTHLHPLAAERFSSLLAARVRPMVQETVRLDSGVFLVFFAAYFLVYSAVPARHKRLLLIVGSVAFYATLSLRFVPLFLGVGALHLRCHGASPS